MKKFVVFDEQGFPSSEYPAPPDSHVLVDAAAPLRDPDGRWLRPDGTYDINLAGSLAFGGPDGRSPVFVPAGHWGKDWPFFAELKTAENPYGILPAPRPETKAEKTAREKAEAAVAAAAEAERVACMSVSMAQFRKALLAAGLLDDVLAIMADPATPRAIVIDWEYASEVRRDWPAWAQFLPILDKTDADLDALFIAAAGL